MANGETPVSRFVKSAQIQEHRDHAMVLKKRADNVREWAKLLNREGDVEFESMAKDYERLARLYLQEAYKLEKEQNEQS